MTKPAWSKSIANLIQTVRNTDGKCVALIGAGCSMSAGIPLAGTLIREVSEQFGDAYTSLPETDRHNYNKVMSALTIMERRKLLNRHIEAARINWAHLALAQLFASGKLDRVLTVNFDPLLVRACAMVGFFPAVYDLATTDRFREAHIAPRSLFYLNGQHTGFITLNAEDELERHRKRLQEIVRNTGTERTWIVVGYSGDADPLLDVLAEREVFEGGLYWVGYDPAPSPRLENKLLSAGKSAFYLGGQDADRFFTELAQRLNCFPPDLLVRPVAHVHSLITCNINFRTGGDAGQHHEESLKRLIAKATAALPEWERDANVTEWLLAGEHQRVLNWYASLTNPDKEDRAFAAWAQVGLGDRKSDDASRLACSDLSAARCLWASAVEHYDRAMTIKPDMHEAANNWGNALAAEAGAVASSDLAEAQRLWDAAAKHYAQALTIKPDKDETSYNWGCALDAEAQATAPKDLLEARHLWATAREHYVQALKDNPKKHEAANNLGYALDTEATALAPTDLPEARRLWSVARTHYAQAMEIKPDKHEAMSNWGASLATEAQFLSPDEAAPLLDQAEQLALRAESIRPGAATYNLACVRSLKGDLPAGLEALRTAHTAGTLPDAAHLRADPDLAPLRADPAFQTWWRELFGPDEPLDAPAPAG